MTDVTERMLTDYVQKLCAEQESLIARFLAETGLKPSEICLVEQPSENGRVFYPEKADRLEQIQKLNDRIDGLVKERDEAVSRLVHRHIIGKAYEVTRENIVRLAGELDEVRDERDRFRAALEKIDAMRAQTLFGEQDYMAIVNSAYTDCADIAHEALTEISKSGSEG